MHTSVAPGATQRLPVDVALLQGCDAGATLVLTGVAPGATLVNEKIYVVIYVVTVYEVKSLSFCASTVVATVIRCCDAPLQGLYSPCNGASQRLHRGVAPAAHRLSTSA